MKLRLLSLAFIVATSFAVLAPVTAQADTKVAVIDVRVVFDQLPQAQEIAKTIEDEFKGQVDSLRQMEKEMTELQERLQRDEAIMSESELQESAGKLQQRYQEYQERRELVTEQLNRRRNEHRNKVLSEIQQVVNEIATKQGYDLVLEAGNVAFAKDSLNITEIVLEQMTKK